MDSIAILAQSGSGFGDFISQMPIGPFIALCLSGILLAVAAFAIVRARSQRQGNRQQRGRTQRAFVPVAAAAKPQAEAAALDDLPDLDLLVDSPPAAPDPQPNPPPIPESQPDPPPARHVRTDTFSITTDDGGTAQAVEVVTILRDVVDGGLIIQIGGKAYRNLSHDETFRGNFLKIMRELSPIVTQAPRPKTVPESAATPAAAVTDVDDAPLVDDLVETTPADSPPPPLGGQMPGDLPQFTLDEEPQVIETKSGLLGRTKKEFIPVPELDIAGAIEAYLQHKLQHTPTYAGRNIHVHPAEDGGVAIEVDGTFYDAVDDVADEAIKTFLSATIQEWQQRNSG